VIDLKTRRIMVRDLSKHLDQRIETVLHDFMDRCEIANGEENDATTLALTILMHYTVMAAHGLGATESDFMGLCQWSFNQAKRQEIKS
jgi:hypothetical protein